MKRMNRRAVLRGTGGIAIALPFLDLMRAKKGHAAEDQARRRLILLTTPNGTISDRWFPDMAQIGRDDFDLSPILSGRNKAMEPHKQDISVMLGVDNKVERKGHLDGMCSLYTGRKALPHGGDMSASGPSLDQYIAGRLAEQESTRTPFSSLVLGTTSKYTNATSTTSYAARRTPVPKIAGAKNMFDRVFGVTSGQSEAMLAMKRSVLDEVAGDIEQVKKKLGRRDLTRLDLHLTSIREIELRLGSTTDIDLSTFVPGETRDHNKALHTMIDEMFDVLELVLVADLTRVINFNMRTEGATSAYTFGWLGIGPEPDPYEQDPTDHSTSFSHHSMSHHTETERNRDYLTTVGAFFVEKWAGLIERLKRHQEGDSTIFDNTVIVHGSPLARGKYHWNNDMPFLLMGSAGGRLKTGQFLNLRGDDSTDFGRPDEDPATHVHLWGKRGSDFRGISHNDLLLTLLHAMGFEDETSFGDPEHCSGPIDALLA